MATHSTQKTLASALKDLPFQVAPTNVDGAFSILPPPHNFDPMTASAEDLIKNGILLPRPTASAHPFVKKAWHRLYAGQRRIEWVTPTLEPQEKKTHLLRKAPRKVSEGNFLNGAWSGAGTRGGGRWTHIAGIWQIPTVSKPTQPQGLEGGWNSSSWVGLDGFDIGIVSNDVLQGGVEQKVSATGAASYVAWFEWFAPQQSNSPSYIFQTNVPSVAVSPGQLVFCAVNYLSFPVIGVLGTVLFLNMLTNRAFHVLLLPPPGATASGNTMEWIMEAPDGGEPTSSLPDFTPVVFLGALASTAAGAIGSPATGDTVNVENTAGTILTSVVTAPALAVVDFIG